MIYIPTTTSAAAITTTTLPSSTTEFVDCLYLNAAGSRYITYAPTVHTPREYSGSHCNPSKFIMICNYFVLLFSGAG